MYRSDCDATFTDDPYRACNGGQLRDDLHATGQCHLQQNGDAVWRRTGIKSTDFLSRNPEIANLFQDYVQNCVMGDIYLNHKYTLEELMASADPYTLIFFPPQSATGRL